MKTSELLKQALDVLEKANDALCEIRSLAHDRSTGPTVPDTLWEIRSMAYEGEQAVPEAIRTYLANPAELSDDTAWKIQSAVYEQLLCYQSEPSDKTAVALVHAIHEQLTSPVPLQPVIQPLTDAQAATSPVRQTPYSVIQSITGEQLADLIPKKAVLVVKENGNPIGVRMTYQQIRQFAVNLVSYSKQPVTQPLTDE